MTLPDDAHFSKNMQSGRGQSRLNESRSLPILPLCRLFHHYQVWTLPANLPEAACQAPCLSVRQSRFRPLLHCWWFHSIWGTCLDVADEHHHRDGALQGPLVSSISSSSNLSKRRTRCRGVITAAGEEKSRPRETPREQDDIEFTLQHLGRVEGPAGIQAFLTQIHGIVGHAQTAQ